MTQKLTSWEYRMLEILNGDAPDETWGAWWTPCLEFLSGFGLCTKSPNYQITDLGRSVLAQRGGDE